VRGTHGLESAGGEVVTRKEREKERGTHHLESAEGGIREDTLRKRESEVHSLTGEHNVRGK
jgi:hypothetical protein